VVAGIGHFARAEPGDAGIDGRMQIGGAAAEMPPTADMDFLRLR
jgi:hypothetical protein